MSVGYSRLWGSLSSRIRWLMVCATLPALIWVGFHVNEIRELAIQAKTQQASLIARSVAASQQQLFDSTHAFLKRLALRPEMQQLSSPACSAYLAEVLRLKDVYVNIGAPDAEGELLCNALPQTKGVNVANRPYFQKAVTQREFSVGAFQIDRAMQVASVNFAYPIIEPKKHDVIGAVVAVVSLDWWSHRLADLALPPGATARVTDADGRVVAQFPPDPEDLGKPAFDAETQAAVARGGAGSWVRNLQGARQELVVYEPLLAFRGKVAATMSVSVPLDRIHQEANQQMVLAVAFLLVGCIAALLVSEWSVRRAVLRPLDRLLHATEEFAQGRHAQGGLDTGLQEFDRLNHRFEQMVHARTDIEARLRSSEQDLIITLDSICDGVIATDAHACVIRMNPVAERLTGWTFEQAKGQPLREVFRLIDSRTSAPLPDPYFRALTPREGRESGVRATLLSRQREHYQVEERAAPIQDADRQVVGVVVVFSDVTQADLARRRLEDNEARFRSLTALSCDWYWELDAQLRLSLVSSPDDTLPEILPIEGQAMPPWLLSMAEENPERWSQVRAHMKARRAFRDVEFQYTNTQGLRRWASISGAPIHSTQGRFAGYQGVGKDISQRKLDENELRIAASAFESNEAMVVCDQHWHILRVNRACSVLTGFTSQDVVGQALSACLSGLEASALQAELQQALAHQGQWAGQVWSRCKDGHEALHRVSLCTVVDDRQAVTHYIAAFSDLTQQQSDARQIEHLAFYDPLTQLPNRRLAKDRLHQACASGARSGQMGGLLCLDLDHFKTINDTLGHESGDGLLKLVAQRLAAVVHEGDTVARLGGDEFLVILEDLGAQRTPAAEALQSVAANVRQALAEPYWLGAEKVYCTTSVGAVLIDHQSASPDSLLKQADMAMYAAKAAGRDALRFFDPHMQAELAARAELERDLRGAVARGELELYYQVQMGALAADRVGPVGAEALLRWHHPVHGMVPPSRFIPLAEETGLIVPIGLWVLETACRQLRIWQDDPQTAHLQLSVNVSARQLCEPAFTEQVAAILRSTGAPPHRLKIELTESEALQDIDSSIRRMATLRTLGISLSMDDFGTGQSSLTQITRLPLDQIKIDQSFVQRIGHHRTDDLIVQTIIGMAQSLQIDVIAEGVETSQQCSFLQQHGCQSWQGYLFSKPLALLEFESLMRRVAGGAPC